MGFHELTGLVRLPLVVLDGAERLGLDREELMRVSGLTASELTDPDSRVPVVKIWQLWKAVIRRSDDPALGLKLAESFETRELGLIGYGLVHSLTLRDALGRLARYSHILNEAIQLSVEERENDVWITTRASPRFDKLRHPLDARLATLISMAREVTRHEMIPLEVRRTIWEELCGGQVSVQRIASSLGLSPRTMQRRLHDADVSFSAVLDELRRAMAGRLLRDKELAIYEVAFLLGYAEPSTFNRAFRRWNGVAPQEFRRTILAANA